MKLIIQRANKALVTVSNEVVGEIEKGLFVLLGVKNDDSEKDAEILANKLIKLRIMSDQEGKMNLSVDNAKGSILVVSQFTLYANTKKGNRPSFIEAGDPKKAERLYNYFIKLLRDKGTKVQTGKFGAYMDIDVKLDGPVTIQLES